jgi:hypothetical protein
MNWNQEDIKLVEKFIEIKNKGYYCDGTQLTQVYNRVLGKNVNVTNCGTCLRGRVSELEAALNQFKAMAKKQEELAQEESKKDEVSNDTPEENKANTEQKKRVGRPKKS